MRFKFISLNIWEGRLLDKTIGFLKKEDADIIAMQEVYSGKNPTFNKGHRSLEILKKEINHTDVFFSPTFINTTEEGQIEVGNAIFSKLPIIERKTVFYDIPFGIRKEQTAQEFALTPRNLQIATVQIQNTTLDVFNNHGIWGLDGEDNARRIAMSRTIVDNIKDRENVILSGDFNVQPQTETIKNIEKHLKNVFKDELTTTFNVKRKIPFAKSQAFKNVEGFKTAVVDMIFISKEIRVTDHYCPKVDVSDHLPLVCVLDLP